MEKDKLPPIPTPVSQRWREFRIQVLPFFVFIAVVVGIVFLWKTYVQPIGVIGAAETNMVNVTSLQDGLLQALFVERFQTVTQGQQIAVVVNTDPELLKAQIESAQADIEVLRERNNTDVQRTDQSYQQFRQTLLSLRVEQAKETSDWILVSNDFRRLDQLKTAGGPVSEASYDSAKIKLQTLTVTIQERAKQIEDLDKSLKELTVKRESNGADPFEDAVEKKAKELELMLKPSTLKAPIDGMVTLVHHLAGERILRGMPIVSISDPITRRIVGYIRQPVTVVPTTNDYVQITTRSQPRQTARGQILRIGAQMEPINPALLSPDTKRMEVGLAILVSVPDGIHLVPGEYVNLTIVYSRR